MDSTTMSTSGWPSADRLKQDERFMLEALRLARRGLGATSPNPMVGAVVVRDGAIVGQGYHHRAGEPHAEIHALDAAGSLAHGATLYCNLEPCSHTGRTGPCVERVVAAGIARVVAAVDDPNPLVRGRGIAYLRAHGVEVEVGLARRAAVRLNETFFTFARFGRPFVTMKVALSADGRIAGANGRPVRLTSDESNARVHALRADVDAIGVGSGTMLADDPLLTARGTARTRPLVRVVFDSRLRTPPSARVFGTLEAGPVIVVTSHEAVVSDGSQVSALEAAGAVVAGTAPHDLGEALRLLAERDVTSLLLEGGATLHRTAWQASLVDRVQVFRTPQVLGPSGLAWFASPEHLFAGMHERRREACGPDVLEEGDVHGID